MKKAVILAGLIVATVGSGLAYADMRSGRGGPQQMPSFEELDLNGDGFVTMEELESQKTERFSETDLNGDGVLSVDEIAENIRAGAEERAQRMIERGDENGDGVISVDELPDRGNMAERLFDRVDQDGDGMVSAEEFEAALQHMQERRHGGPRGGNH